METQVNIPIYRALKIGTENEWVEGYLYGKYIIEFAEAGESYYIDDSLNMCIDLSYYHKIDSNTLAIHFDNMLDKNGKKIFVSLSDDGVGGDIVQQTHTELHGWRANCNIAEGYVIFNKNGCALIDEELELRLELMSHCEIIGIHKG